MSVLLFDERNEIVFTPKKKSYIPLQIKADSLTDCKVINRNETTSLSRRIFTGGISKTKNKRYLQIDFIEEENTKEPLSLLFDLNDKIDSVYNTISLVGTISNTSISSAYSELTNNLFLILSYKFLSSAVTMTVDF